MAVKLTATERAGLIELVEHSFSNAKTFQFQLRTYTQHTNVGMPTHNMVTKFKLLYMKIKNGKWETFETKENTSLQKLLGQIPWAAIDEITEEPDIGLDILGGSDEEDMMVEDLL